MPADCHSPRATIFVARSIWKNLFVFCSWQTSNVRLFNRHIERPAILALYSFAPHPLHWLASLLFGADIPLIRPLLSRCYSAVISVVSPLIFSSKIVIKNQTITRV
jgi:hypothetical protein